MFNNLIMVYNFNCIRFCGVVSWFLSFIHSLSLQILVVNFNIVDISQQNVQDAGQRFMCSPHLKIQKYVSRQEIFVTVSCVTVNPLNTKHRLLYLKTQFILRSFHLGYKNQSVCIVWGKSHHLFSDKYKTHKYSVGRM